MAVMRLWHGEVPLDLADEYEEFLVKTAVPDYGSVPGLLKLFFLRRDEKDAAHFQLMTLWDSLESVKLFAGENPEQAKYYPEDDRFLRKKEKNVSIYRVFYEQA